MIAQTDRMVNIFGKKETALGPMLFGQERKLFGLRSCRYFYPHGVFG